jgi:ribosomal protein S27AE
MADHLTGKCPDCGKPWITRDWIKDTSLKSGKTAVAAVCATAEDVTPTSLRDMVSMSISAVTGGSETAMKLIGNLQDQIDLGEYEQVCMNAQGLDPEGDQWVCTHCGYIAYKKQWAD